MNENTTHAEHSDTCSSLFIIFKLKTLKDCPCRGIFLYSCLRKTGPIGGGPSTVEHFIMTCLQEVALRQQSVHLMDTSTRFINQQRICEGYFIRVDLPQRHVGEGGMER